METRQVRCNEGCQSRLTNDVQKELRSLQMGLVPPGNLQIDVRPRTVRYNIA
jgi:hypothetical protein